MSRGTKTSPWQKAALLLFGLLLAFVSLEVGMRLSAFGLSAWQGYWNWRAAKKEGVYRILCIGESTTHNQYPRFLGRILNGNGKGSRFTVIDKGLTGTNTSIVLNQIHSNLDTYRPHIVVAMMGINDQGVSYYKDIPEKSSRLFRESHAYRLLRTLMQFGVERICHGANKTSVVGGWMCGAGGFSPEEDSYHRAIAFNPQNRQAYLNLGQWFIRGARNSEAERAFLKVLDIDPRCSIAYFELGQIYQGRGLKDLAQQFFERALEAAPKSYKAFIELKRLMHKNTTQDEDVFLQETVDMNPSFSGYMILGRFYHDQRSWERAEYAFQKAAHCDPSDSSARLKLGEIYRSVGRFPEAIDQYEKALEVDPKNNAALGGLISTSQEMGRPELAEERVEKALFSDAWGYSTRTARNFKELVQVLKRRGIQLICVQYPMRSIAPLKKIFGGESGVVFVDNEQVFKKAVKMSGYREYFVDMFAGDFGHCTAKGNELLAQNIAEVILREVFQKK